MKKALPLLALLLAGFFVVKGCSSSPERQALGTVKEFMEAIRDKDSKDAVNLLYPPYRDALAQQVNVPIQFVELKPSEMVGCVLTSMGEKIKEVKYLDASKIDDTHTEVVIKVVDKDKTEKILSFILVKDGKSWKIANISTMR
ncbi:DUF4878 domain-containing protein [Thermocrinis minervae]|uniref:DUF4878 domain-containing protein n=1 Tax=Thermocrinis minervae TaxID=381751 RepID=A0A1M6SCY9_9AQUI|nr:DUF4878 domain-containing protein [Thermocrinis minervae]SHK42634.1 protein of unknown function [Thermocrinis minervae]